MRIRTSAASRTVNGDALSINASAATPWPHHLAVGCIRAQRASREVCASREACASHEACEVGATFGRPATWRWATQCRPPTGLSGADGTDGTDIVMVLPCCERAVKRNRPGPRPETRSPFRGSRPTSDTNVAADHDHVTIRYNISRRVTTRKQIRPYGLPITSEYAIKPSASRRCSAVLWSQPGIPRPTTTRCSFHHVAALIQPS